MTSYVLKMIFNKVQFTLNITMINHKPRLFLWQHVLAMIEIILKVVNVEIRLKTDPKFSIQNTKLIGRGRSKGQRKIYYITWPVEKKIATKTLLAPYKFIAKNASAQ